MVTTPLWIISSALVLTIAANLFPLLYVLKGVLHKRLNQIVSLHIIGIVGWATFILLIVWLPFMTGQSTYIAGDAGYKIEQAIFLFASLWIVANYWFIREYTRDTMGGRPFVVLLTIFQLGTFFALLSNNVFFSAVTIEPQGYALLAIEPWSLTYSLFLLVHLSLPLIMLIRARRRETDHVRRAQIRILLFIYSIFFVASVLLNWVLPVYAHIFTLNALGPTISLVLVAGMIYAITRHEFLGIARFAQRSVIFTALLGVIVAAYLAIIFFTSYVFGAETTTTVLASAGLVTVLGIFTVPRIDQFLRKITDPYFFKNPYEYAEALYSLSEAVNSKLRLRDIVTETEQTLAKFLRASSVSVSTSDGKTVSSTSEPAETTDDRMTLTTPILFEGRHIGAIFLGEKLSGDQYTDEDISLMRTFANQIALAFEKARLFKQVEDYSKELETRVEARTKDIKMLQEEQSHMMLDIAHRLQNPLTFISGEAELLKRKDPDNKELSVFMHSIHDASEFIYDLLHLARLETHTVGVNSKPVDLSSLLLELVEEFEVMASGNDIRLLSRIQADLWLNGDADRLKELVTNLVSNAIKYMGDRAAPYERMIMLTCEQHGPAIELAVADTGVGIPKEALPHVFDRFYRVHENGHGGVTGTGLGLAICKKIAELHNGTISVASTPGAGTTFTITLPARRHA